jgi:two-component system, cell cycle response regulator
MPPSPMDRVLQYPSLPSLPGVAMRVLELTRDRNVSMQDIAQAVTADPALVAKVLKTVNSSYYGLSQPCPSIPRAMSMLGMNTVKSIVLGFSLVDMTKGVAGDGQAFDLQAYWRRAVYSAVAARTIAQKTRACDAEEAFVGALIADIGMLACFAALKDEYANVLAAAPEDHAECIEVERTALSFDHAQVGMQLAGKWRLPEQLGQCVGYHHEPEKCRPELAKLLQCVALGQLAATVLSVRESKQKLGAFIVKGREWFSIDRETSDAILEATTKGAGELAKSLELKTGEKPDMTAILAQAQESLIEQQMAAQQNADALKRDNEQLTLKTITDALTGAFNRAHFDAELRRNFEMARTSSTPLAVLFLDGDKFKSVNDTLGHQAGDAVLRELSARARGLLSKTGIVCRYGGEEFAIILPGVSLAKAARIGELLRSVIAKTPFDLRCAGVNVEAHPVTVSIGVSAMEPSFAASITSAELLTRAADEGVYAAKRAGRNRVCSVSPKPKAGASAGTATTPTKAAEKPAAAVAKPSVLIIEDDPLAAKLLTMLFSKRSSFAPTAVGSAEAALAHLGGEGKAPPEFVICDMHLPGVTGLQFIKTMRAKLPSLMCPVILVSALADDNLRAMAGRGGAAMCMSKGDLCADFEGSLVTIQKLLTQQAAVQGGGQGRGGQGGGDQGGGDQGGAGQGGVQGTRAA